MILPSDGRKGFGYEFASHPVNRDRIYNYYRRQAAHFLKMRNDPTKETPALLPQFPEVDGSGKRALGKISQEQLQGSSF